jgi:hypothetical protein
MNQPPRHLPEDHDNEVVYEDDDTYEDEDEQAARVSVGDPVTGKTRRLSRQCDTCIFRAGNLMYLEPGRLKDLVDEAVDQNKFIVCHETLPGMPGEAAPAICRGFHDRYTTAALRIIARLWGFVDIEPPSTTGR